MKEEELINWFWNNYNSCYPVLHSDYPESIFLFYDKQFIRKIKLCQLSGKEIKFPKKVKGICLFEQDWKNKRFYYNYDEIYLFLNKNFDNNYENINNFIEDRLKEADKLSTLTTREIFFNVIRMLKEADKLSTLTTRAFVGNAQTLLKEADKLSTLTTLFTTFNNSLQLKEADKLSVLTPHMRDWSSLFWTERN